MESIPPTLPFHVAKAYNVKANNANAVSGHAKSPQYNAAVTVKPVAPVATGGVDRLEGTRGLDKVDLPTAKKAATIKQRLVAAVVPGGVSFSEGVAQPSKPTVAANTPIDRLPFYRHPADKNAAATGINLGRRIDTNG